MKLILGISNTCLQSTQVLFQVTYLAPIDAGAVIFCYK